MSKKHNTKHTERQRSNYPLRLEKRGLSKAPQMEGVESLRKRQERREEETGALLDSSGRCTRGGNSMILIRHDEGPTEDQVINWNEANDYLYEGLLRRRISHEKDGAR